LIAEVQRGLIFSDGADRKLWKFHSSGMYSTKSGCVLFYSLSATENNHSPVLLWNSYAPPKVVHMASSSWQFEYTEFFS